jgi:maleylpyruvate isomerase
VLRIYRIPFSTNVERVALAAAFKGLDVDWVDVEPTDRTVVRELSGQDLVPVLERDGDVVIDSTGIIRYLEAWRPDPPLFPRDAARRAELEVFLDWFDGVWKRPPNELEDELTAERPGGARISELSLRMRTALDLFEALLDGREYLFGEFSAADCAAFPFLKYAELSPEPGDDELFHQILVEHQPLGDDHPRLRAWIERVDARPRA